MIIRHLKIERFRCFDFLEWKPTSRINCLVGPGDSGKSTVLAALEYLFDPNRPPTASELDYHRRRVDDGFEIRAIVGGLSEELLASFRVPLTWGWKSGALTGLPDEDGAEPVLWVRAVGTPDLDVVHTVVAQSDEVSQPFTAAVRRRMLFSRVTTAARAWTELRLGRGTLLDRHLDTPVLERDIRAAATKAVMGMEIPSAAETGLSEIRDLFLASGLPSDLALGMITPRGWSLISLLGLVEGADREEAIPLAFAGSGTRQLAIYRLATGLMDSDPVVAMDEPEAGLEPYRQRALIRQVRHSIGESGQAFITSHSPAILESLSVSEIVRLLPGENPRRLEGDGLQRVVSQVPDALLCKMPVLCEGATEVGLLSAFFDHYARIDEVDGFDALGIRLVERQGQPSILNEASDFANCDIPVAAFVDNEESYSGRRERLAGLGCIVASWDGPKDVEAALAKWLPFSQLDDLVEFAAQLRSRDVTPLRQEVGSALGSNGDESLTDLLEAYSELDIRRALGVAASRGRWFKRVSRGRRLAEYLLDVGVPKSIDATLRDFWMSLREHVE